MTRRRSPRLIPEADLLPIDRRAALKGLAALAAASGLPGCAPPAGAGDDDTAPDDDTVSDDDTASGPGAIDTVVFLMMENRTFDHYFGSLSLEQGRKDVDGLAPGMSNPDSEGNPVEVFPLDEYCVEDPPHGWDSSHAQWNGGANDGFVREHEARVGPEEGRKVMGYYREKDLPVYYALARGGALCQRWFSSVMGPTWPNRVYGHAAQSQGMRSNELPEAGEGEWGFTCKTIWDLLDEAGISWGYYYASLPFLGLWGSMTTREELRPIDRFFEDAAAGNLPRVVWVDPVFGINDDHPDANIAAGQMFVSTVFAALAKSAHWERSLFIVTYDEHGGFFDHVPPPTTADDRAEEGFDQLGFRVPALVAGPYVKQGHVSSTVRDHTSWLKEVQRLFGLPSLTARDAAANDLSDLIDEGRLQRNEPLPPPELPEVEYTEEELDALCRGAARRRNELDDAADRGLIPRRLDLRPRTRETLRLIGAWAERLGTGRIRTR